MREEICSKCGRMVNVQGVCGCNQSEIPDAESAIENARDGYVPVEYTTLTVDEHGWWESTLDELGRDGWQMTGTSPAVATSDPKLIFMRQIRSR